MPRKGRQLTDKELQAIARLAAKRQIAHARADAADAEWEQYLGSLHRDGVPLRAISNAVNELPDVNATPQTVKNYADKHYPVQ